jgi:hypothetical protein
LVQLVGFPLAAGVTGQTDRQLRRDIAHGHTDFERWG